MDHERVNIHTSGISCGVLELSRIDNDHKGVCYAVATHLYHPSRGTPAAFVIWSNVAPPEFGDDTLCDFIRKHGFGIITASVAVDNPKTGNMIQVWTWAIQHGIFKEWYAKERVAKLKNVGRS